MQVSITVKLNSYVTSLGRIGVTFLKLSFQFLGVGPCAFLVKKHLSEVLNVIEVGSRPRNQLCGFG